MSRATTGTRNAPKDFAGTLFRKDNWCFSRGGGRVARRWHRSWSLILVASVFSICRFVTASRILPRKKIIRITAILGLIGSVILAGGSTPAQSGDERLSTFDAAAARIATLEENPHFRRDVFFGSAHNLVAVADRWATIRPLIEESIESVTASAIVPSIDLASPSVAGKPISKVTLGASRYSGFTQSETATAWCGASVAIGFNDTGSEVRSILWHQRRERSGIFNLEQ